MTMIHDDDTEKGAETLKDVDASGGSTPPLGQPAKAEAPFPEGGLAAWSTVAGAFLVQFCTFGYSQAYGVYQDFYVREYMTNRTSSEISWIGSVQLMLMLSSGLVTGFAYDRGYFHHLMIGGSVLLSFSLFMLSLSHPNQYYQVFLSQGLGMGLAFGMTYIASVGVVSHYFQRRRNLVMGAVASGSSLGGLVHPIMLNNLFHGKAGFQKGVRYSATLVLCLLVIANCLMRTRLPPKPTPVKIMVRSAVTFARDVPYVFATFGTVVAIMGLFFPFFYLQLDSINHGLDPTFSFYTIAIVNGASVVGRVLVSFLAHRLGVLNTIVFCAFVCGVLVLSMFGVTTVGAVIAFSILYGFFSGGYASLLAPMLASLSHDFTEIGTRMGVGFTFTGLGSLVGSPIAGALLTSSFQWWRPIIFGGITLLSGAASIFVTRMLVASKRGQRV